MIKNIVIAVLLILLVAASAFFYLGSSEGINKLSGLYTPSPKAPELQVYTLEKVLLTFPEPGNTKLHHAQLDVVLTSFDPGALETFKKLDPLLRNVIVEIAAQKTFGQFKELKDINLMQSDIQKAFVTTFVKYKVNPGLLDVKLSKIILQ